MTSKQATAIHAVAAFTPEGWRPNVRLKLAGSSIAAVEVGVAPERGDERHEIVLPALSNLHSHAFQRGMAGLAEFRGRGTDSFWTWRETMYRFAQTMSPEDVEAVAAQAYLEMLEAGFAAVAEFHYLHRARDGSTYPERAEMAHRVLAAAREVGIGLTLLPVFYAHGAFAGAPPKPEQRRFVNDLESYARLLEDCRRAVSGHEGETVGVAPHSLRAVAGNELSEIVAFVDGGPIHIHIAEQEKEVEDCLAWSGARPVRWLIDHAEVDGRWCLVHATHMDEDETRDLAASGAVAGLCPITEANLGDGVFNGRNYLISGGRFGVGTDSNVAIGAAEELRQLEYSQRLHSRTRNVLAPAGRSNGRAMFEKALAGGARALARPSGRLEAGALADILTIRADHPTLSGKAGDTILDAWIFSIGGGAIDCVWSGGRKVVIGGRHVGREQIAKRFRTALLRLVD